MKQFLLFISTLFLPQILLACPFCDYGANDTAYFVITFFGLIALGAICFFIIFVRSGLLKENKNVSASILEIEGITKDSHEH